MSDVMKQVELGEVASFIRGITFKPKDVVELGTDNSVACFRTKNVQKDLDLRDVWAVPRAFVKQDIKILKHGDLLVSTANSWNLVGKCSWIPKLDYEATLGGFISALRPDITEVVPRYLYHWFAYGKTQANVRKCARQTTNISNLNIQQCLSIEIPLPPLPEQKRIAAILDQADALIRLRQKSLDRLNQLGQSIFYDMFGDPVTNPMGWPLVKIGDVTNCIVPGRDKPKSFTGNIPWITTGELISLGFTGKKQAKLLLSEVEITKVRAKIIPKNSVLMTCVGDLGVTSIANENMVINQQLHSFQCREMSKAHYLLYAISHQKNWMFQRSTQTTLPYMNKTVCNSIPLQLPPIELQNKFSVRLDSLNKQKSQITRAITKSKKLFLALQDSAFRGEL